MNEGITTRSLKKHQKRDGKWRDFDDFKSWRTELWTITVTSSGVKCTCPFYTKNGQCKHALGIQIRRKEVSVPTEAKCIPLGQKRKRGRPAKTKKARIVQ